MARIPRSHQTQAVGRRGVVTHQRAGSGVARAAGQAGSALPPGYQAAARYAITPARQGCGASKASLLAGHTPPPAARVGAKRADLTPPTEAAPLAPVELAAPVDTKATPGPAELAAAHPQLALAFAVAAAAAPVLVAQDAIAQGPIASPSQFSESAVPASVVDALSEPVDLVPTWQEIDDVDAALALTPSVTASAPAAISSSAGADHRTSDSLPGRHASRTPRGSRPKARSDRTREQAAGPAGRWERLFDRTATRHSRSSVIRRAYRPVSAGISAALVGLITLAAFNSGGTLALWKDSADTNGGVIVAGDLDIKVCDPALGLQWEETAADVALAGLTPRSSTLGDSLADFKAMPGDSILLKQCVEVTMDGDNLAAAIEVTAWADIPALGLVTSPGATLAPDDPPPSRISGTYAIKDLTVGSATNGTNLTLYDPGTAPPAPGDTSLGSSAPVGTRAYVLVPAMPYTSYVPGRTVTLQVEVTIDFAATDSGDPDHVLAFDSKNFGYGNAYQNLATPGATPADVGLVEFGIIANQVRFGDGWTS